MIKVAQRTLCRGAGSTPDDSKSHHTLPHYNKHHMPHRTMISLDIFPHYITHVIQLNRDLIFTIHQFLHPRGQRLEKLADTICTICTQKRLGERDTCLTATSPMALPHLVEEQLLPQFKKAVRGVRVPGQWRNRN